MTLEGRNGLIENESFKRSRYDIFSTYATRLTHKFITGCGFFLLCHTLNMPFSF